MMYEWPTIAPENRGFARLVVSNAVKYGQLKRLMLNGRPCIMVHPNDLNNLRRIVLAKGYRNCDQVIADAAEQMFADWELECSTRRNPL